MTTYRTNLRMGLVAVLLACLCSLSFWFTATACDLSREDGFPPAAAASHLHAQQQGLIFASALAAGSNYSATIVGAVALGAAPHGVAVAPDGRQLYVTDFNARGVSVIDAAQLTVIDTITVGRGAVNVLLTADGTRAYVTNELDDTLSVIDTTTRQVIRTIPLLDRPHGMALGVDPTTGAVDQRLYVANLGSDQVSVLNTATLDVIIHVAVGNTPDSPLATSDGKHVWVTNYGEGEASTLSLVDTLSFTEIYTLPVGIYPHGIKFAPDGSQLYVSVQGEDKLVVVDPATRQLVATYPAGNAPHGLGISPDGGYLWTGDLVSRTSTIVDAHSGALIGQVNTGALSNPHAIAFAPDGYRAYISDFTGRRLLVIRVQRPTLYLPLALNP